MPPDCNRSYWREVPHSLPTPQIARTARSTVRAVPYTYVTDSLDYLQQTRRAGRLILGLELTTTSESLFTYRLTSNRAIVIVAGTEATGVSDALLAECAATVPLTHARAEHLH